VSEQEATPAVEQPVVSVQDAVDRVAAKDAPRSLPDIMDRLVEELDRVGLQPPSRTWLDSVARDLAAGRRYVVSLEGLGRPDRPPGGHEEEYDAPADLSVVAPEDSDRRADAEARAPEVDRAAVRREALPRLAVLLAALAGYVLIARRRYRRTGKRATTARGRDRPHDR
jgi:hypothetical protein